MSERRTRRRTEARNRRRWGFIAGNILALALSTAVAAWTFWPVYQSTEFLLMVGLTYGIGVVIAVLGTLFGWKSWTVALAVVLAYLVTGVPLAIPSLAADGLFPTAEGLLELLAATALSWKQLVTIVLPVGAYQSLLVPAFLLVLVSTVIGLSTAVRSRRPALAVLAPVALFMAGIALGPTVAPMPVEAGLALFVVTLFWLLWLRSDRRRRAVRLVAQQSRGTIESTADRRLGAARGLVSAAAIMAIAIAAGTAATLAIPSSSPRDVVRARVQQPFDPRDYPSPLSGFRSYLQPELVDETLLSVEGLPSDGRLRVATLDTYDGVVYSVGSDTVSSESGSFTRLPYRLDQGDVPGKQVSLTITVEGYSGIWVPGDGQLEQIEFTGDSAAARADSFYYNDTTGTAALLGGLTQGDRYHSQSVVPRSIDDLAALKPGNAMPPSVGVWPEGLRDALAGYVDSDDPPGVQLQSMLESLKANGYISHGIGEGEPVSRSGHGADRITQLFADRPMLGDQEQYAVAAALMARELGFPARVVFGFAPDVAGPGPVTVSGADVSAWIEVQDTDDGWVSIDPNPAPREVPAAVPDEPTIVSRPQSIVPPPAEDAIPQRDLTQPDSSQDDPAAPVDPVLAMVLAVLRVAGWTLLGLALLLSPFLAVIGAKLQRRRLRKRAPVPLDRIRGGWREFADTAIDLGIDVPPAATRTELAETVGGMPSLVLASVVDRADFAPGSPTVSDADEVWQAVTDLRRSLAESRNHRERWKARISLRSLGRYAGRTRKGGGGS